MTRSRDRRRVRVSLIIWLVISVAVVTSTSCSELQWAKDLRKFDQQDRDDPPPHGGIVFVGSSSIAVWSLELSFPGYPVVNRGLGGSQISHAIHFADRLVFPYEPSVVVLYAGDNDVASGKTPERVIEDYQNFVQTVHGRLPECRIVFISIKPSLARWAVVDQMREANQKVAKFSESDDRLFYADIDTPLIGRDALPRPELYAEDGLHMTVQGYEIWSSVLEPILRIAFGRGHSTDPADSL